MMPEQIFTTQMTQERGRRRLKTVCFGHSLSLSYHAVHECSCHPAVFEELKHPQEKLGLLKSHVVLAHLGEWNASGGLPIARRPIIFDVATSEEDSDEKSWREAWDSQW